MQLRDVYFVHDGGTPVQVVSSSFPGAEWVRNVGGPSGGAECLQAVREGGLRFVYVAEGADPLFEEQMMHEQFMRQREDQVRAEEYERASAARRRRVAMLLVMD
jgi:hypothetical protein